MIAKRNSQDGRGRHAHLVRGVDVPIGFTNRSNAIPSFRVKAKG
jgi:hypothetical protein